MKKQSIFLIIILFLLIGLIFQTNLFETTLATKDNPDYKNLLESEKNTIIIFENNVESVVNVSSMALARTWWDFEPVNIPTGAGSGFVWDTNGHIVTNYHVVAQGGHFHISFHKNKKQYKAKIVGIAPKKDIAVLKVINGPKNLYPVQVGDSQKLKVGQKTVALGNPFGFDHTITSGIVSALDRQIDGVAGVKIRGMIQTDASINPGNSGGPLLDSKGRLIGMNTVIISSSGASAGLGFAVPVNTIKRIVPQLIKYGKVIRPIIGVGILQDSISKRYFGIEKGLAITFVDDGSPADKAGLRGMSRDHFGQYYLGDVIISIDGHKLESYDDIFHVLEKYKIGDTVTLTISRDERIKKVEVTLTGN